MGFFISEKTEKIVAHSEQIRELFRKLFVDSGYIQLPSVDISSGLDPSVRLIGSHISPMKPYFVAGDKLEVPMVMNQPCIRTHNLSKIGDPDFMPKWGSFFYSMGAIVNYENMDTLYSNALGFLASIMPASDSEPITIRANSQDKDLVSLCNDTVALELDTMPESYYRHSIGVDRIQGRNFNFAIPNHAGEIADVGNLIVLEYDGHPRYVELALGTSTCLKQFRPEVDHVLDTHALPSIEDRVLAHTLCRQFQDAVLTSSVLASEGLEASNRNNASRLYKKYLKHAFSIGQDLGFNEENVLDFATLVHQREIRKGKDNFLSNFVPR